ncbi:multidrug effflux MFS transporter [Mucilaginibacter sp. RS28]|uniref:Multidrug effflux MFS transporter n=1 Tax=Mucilaginibacter straminoryzae TaxID=2932774 RepID=A0A9X1X2E9_9SPHI|nr:multidrug effflux MFS transporter [Mucilaginibacter straminoryzae]MCJ8208288.1 multidrug effflux MFS transporter [Mucilaginibacter straminoryzae]
MTDAATEPTKPLINRAFLIFILGLMATLDPFSIDFYLPAFPQIASHLHSTSAKISLSMSSYFIGLAIGQISYGPLVDRFGRKGPLYFGLIAYTLACVGCMSATSVNALIIFRFLQALTGGVAATASYAMVRDFFSVDESASIFSLLILIIGISPLIAPTLGGFIADSLGWQWVFVMLAIFAVILIALVFFYLPAGRAADPSVSLHPVPILTTFFSILRNPQFITYNLAGTFSFSSLFIYLAGAPVIMMDVFKLTTNQFGLLFTLLAVGFIGSSQLNVYLLKKFKSQQIFKTALLVQIVTCTVFIIGALNNWFGIVTTVILFFIILSCCGMINPNGSALALAPFEHNVGSAAALMGFIMIGVSGLISGLVGFLGLQTDLPIAAMMFGTCLLSVIILLIGSRKIKAVTESTGSVTAHI